MKCYECKCEMKEKLGPLELEDDTLGNYWVEGIKYYQCGHCGELAFPAKSLEAIEAKENEVQKKLINKLPIEEFVSAKEAYGILGITRQAFHKHHRIKHGFIYSATISENKFYHKKSVTLFKKRMDGRFPLGIRVQKASSKMIQYVSPCTMEDIVIRKESREKSKNENYRTITTWGKPVSLVSEDVQHYPN